MTTTFFVNSKLGFWESRPLPYNGNVKPKSGLAISEPVGERQEMLLAHCFIFPVACNTPSLSMVYLLKRRLLVKVEVSSGQRLLVPKSCRDCPRSGKYIRSFNAPSCRHQLPCTSQSTPNSVATAYSPRRDWMG
jgi:hypothetical protein